MAHARRKLEEGGDAMLKELCCCLWNGMKCSGEYWKELATSCTCSFLVRYLHSFQHSSIPASNSDWRTAVPCSRPCTLFLPYTQTTLLLQLCLHCRPPTFGSSALRLVLFIAALLSVPSGIPVRVVFPFSLSELIEAPVYIGFGCQPCPNLAPNPNKTHCHVNNQRIISWDPSHRILRRLAYRSFSRMQRTRRYIVIPTFMRRDAVQMRRFK
jgi:hypothetical protein